MHSEVKHYFGKCEKFKCYSPESKRQIVVDEKRSLNRLSLDGFLCGAPFRVYVANAGLRFLINILMHCIIVSFPSGSVGAAEDVEVHFPSTMRKEATDKGGNLIFITLVLPKNT